MYNKIKYTCRSIWLLALLLSSTLLWAQNAPFHGDSASGYAYTRTNLLNCNTFRFQGDSAEGYAVNRTQLLNCNTFRFQGDSADGFSTVNTNLLNCNTFRFQGDSSEGFSVVNTNSLNCNTFRFQGDTADGFSTTNTNLLNCNTFRFHGDSSSGYTSVSYVQIRKFLGPDTSVLIICSSDTYNLLSLYNAPGLSYSWSSPTPAAVGLGNFTLIATNQSGCKDTAVATVGQNIARWRGTISSNWHNPANWDGGKIPNETTHVIIPGGTPNACQISDDDAKAASVQGRVNGSLSIINNRILTIYANCSSLPAGN